MKELPIGISDFKTLRENNYFYIDKSLFIENIAKSVGKTLLFTRPRRFGKTMSMSMLRYFFDIKNADDNKKLFHGLNIEKTAAWNEQGKYPVIFISFKDLKIESWEECFETIGYLITNLYNNHKEIIEKLDEVDKEKFISSIKGELNYVKLKFSLKLLSELLYKTYNKKVIILIDEYDTPIISAYANKYYDKIIDFFKNFYSSALKDNEYLQFGIMTGIIRVAKEGIFSGLNNLDVYTILDEKFSDFFGLKEDDIDNALKEYKLLDSIDDVKKWYNGYKFGNYDIYNPWSIIKYLNTKKLGAYWVNTSDNYLINEVLDLSDEDIFSELMNLVNNSVTEQYIDESMTFDNLSIQDSLWTLLLSGGYLTIKEKIETGIYLLKIPNKEIYSFFKDILIEKFDKKYT